jgi:GTP-binding protein EngB required for normal cell division
MELVSPTASEAQSSTSETGVEHGSGLHNYLKFKLRFAEVIQAILQDARQASDAHDETECRSLLSRLAADRFNLVVVGQFNRGKSTLMNAVLGVDRLPTGVLPLTSVITSVGYGDRERVLLHRDDQGLPIEIPLAHLAEHVTEAGNPGNRRGIAVAEVQLPVELLRLGFHFVDTPGVGSAIAENTRTTQAFLPEADAAIFVTSFDSPMDERELELLAQVLDHVRQVFVVINKADVISSEQRDAVISFVRGRLPERLTANQSALFPVSALRAMRARMEGDADALDESGILELERAMLHFLRVQKTREFLLRLADRTGAILHKQENLLRLSEQAGSSPEQCAELSLQLRRRTDALHRELRGAMDNAKGRSVIAFRKRFEPELAAWLHQSTPNLLDKVQDWLSGAGLEKLLVAGDELASEIGSGCRDLMERWLANRRHLFDLELETELQRAGPLIDHILDGTERLMGDFLKAPTPAASKSAAPWTPGVGNVLSWPDLPAFQWKPGAFLSLWTIPAPPLRRVVVRHLSRRLDASLLTYGNQMFELLGRAIEQSMDGVHGNLDAKIDAEASRILGALRGGSFAGRLNAIGDLRLRLNALRAEVEAIPLEEEPASAHPRAECVAAKVRARQTLKAHAHCIICQRVVASLFEYMSSKQYKLSVAAAEQQQHAASSGFCAIHTWYYESVASPQGICLAYPPVLAAVAGRLRMLAHSGASSQSLVEGVADLLPAAVKCPACQLAGAVEKTAAREIVGGLTESMPGGAPSLPPLCLVHLYTVLNAKPGEEQARILLQAQASVLERIAEDMRTYALKHNAVRRELATNEESNAYRTALLRLVGHRYSGRGVL